MIVVVRPCILRVRCNQVIAADMADDVTVRLLRHGFVSTEDEDHKLPVLLHLVAQSLRIVAVDLDVAVKGLRLGIAVEGIISILRVKAAAFEALKSCPSIKFLYFKCYFHYPTTNHIFISSYDFTLYLTN